ncbi:MAG TPA: DUF6152 family protein, partial [Vicinamibacterales bacterium]|nr:DUF6152 family protein [Vicinamibacterales bacterium]
MTTRLGIVIALIVAAASPAAAHHGFGTFDVSKTVSFPGATITRVDFINPHSWLYFELKDADGKVRKMRCEMRSAHVLRRSGWEVGMFKAGQRADITASPDRADPASCYLQTIVFADGTRMDRYGQYVKAPDGLKEVRGPIRTVKVDRPARRPTGEPNISGDWAPEQVVMADPRGTGGPLVPLSTIAKAQPGSGGQTGQAGGGGRGRGQAAGPRLYGGTELTELGAKMAAAFTQKDNPRFQCETTSIIFDWTFDGPVNRITQNRDTIVIEYGQLNLRRTVHMNMKSHPPGIRPSRAGHSIGWWEGDTLVVDTVGFLPGVLNPPVRHGSKLHVVERFTLDPQTMRLTR